MMILFSNLQKNLGKCVAGAALITCANSMLHAETLLMRNVQIVSANHQGKLGVTSPQDVLIRDGVIAAIGKKLGHADRELDGRGRYLTPGLIDTHVHLAGVPGYIAERSEDAVMLQDAVRQIPRSYLYFGFTTVLDLTGDPVHIKKWNAQEQAPLAHFCAPVTIPNGYPAALIGKDAQFHVPATKYMLFDPQQSSVYPSSFQAEQHTPRNVVSLAKADGANCIKVFYETGFGQQKNLPVPSVALIQEVVAHARALGMPVYQHGNSQAAYEFALKAGVSTLVHGMWHADQHATPEINLASAKRIANDLKKADIAIQPTIQVLHGEHELFNPDYFKDAKVQQAIPSRLIQWYQSTDGQWMKNGMAKEFAPDGADPIAQYQKVKAMYHHPLDTVASMTRQLNKQGARLLFGSDTPSGPFYTQFPGVNGRGEMDRWLEAGIGLPQLFKAMTFDNAHALGQGKKVGRVAVGLRADLLLMAANPLENISAYDQILSVVVRGRLFQRSELGAVAP